MPTQLCIAVLKNTILLKKKRNDFCKKLNKSFNLNWQNKILTTLQKTHCYFTKRSLKVDSILIQVLICISNSFKM